MDSSRSKGQHATKKRKRSDGTSMQVSKKKRQSLKFQTNTLTTGPELKNVDVGGTVSSTVAGLFNNPGAGALLNGVAQGTTENQRVGRKIQMKSLLINWALDNSATVGEGFRILVVYDKQPSGGFPLATDILFSTSELSAMQLNNADRFIVLHNEFINQNGTACATIGSFYVKMGLDAVYTSTGALIANMNTGSIYLMFANATTASRTLNFFSRVRYLDA